MKKMILAATTALLCAAASAEDAYIYPTENMKVGETVQLQSPTVLFINKKCDLPFVDAAHMRFYASYRSDASNRGTWDTGCWAKNIHGDAIIVVLRMPNRTIALKTLARADVQKDGTATIKALPAQGR
ncbi:hypothetical protein AB4156_06120 [Cupriavidus sp. 2MCAB6]|uniref:hypothetical protein n=1 Tax=Cupriavidus sp. 2MCAB6 TaxID=3232981 RepID=UPI003F90FD8C